MKWLTDRIGLVRVQQLFDTLRHRLSFVPGLYVLGAIIVVQVMLLIDRQVDGEQLPDVLKTTVDSARSVLGAMAGGLITSITLLLSMMLITIQLASGQFSPRTLRDWLGDRVLQHAIGLALGTTVYCLLALRSARSFGEGDDATAVTPHFSVLLALALGISSLFAVVRAVDHITHSVRLGSVSRRIANDTIAVIESSARLESGQRPGAVPAEPTSSEHEVGDIPDGAWAVEALHAGWIQQIDEDAILEMLPDGCSAYVTATLGGFVAKSAPLMWIDPAPSDDEACRAELLDAFAMGDSRTLQQDAGFGIMQLTDIAVRALSPGINDPGTAADVVVQLSNVMITLWSVEHGPVERSENGRTIHRQQPDHGEFLRRAFEPIRRYGLTDPIVLGTMVRELFGVCREVERRELAGSVEPIHELIDAVESTADRSTWSPAECEEFDALVQATR